MDKSVSLAEIELARIDWSKLREIRSSFGERIVSADYVPSVVRALLNAKTPEEAEELEWKIENHIFVQRCLFEAAEHLVPVLIALLPEVPQGFIKNTILALLFEIVSGYPDQSEIALGNDALADRCRVKAREGLWTLYQLFIDGDEVQRSFVFDVLEAIETDPSRLEAFTKAVNFEEN
ncbi:MAG TPA: hypothetical protein VIL74_14595 [Pyrinomonadaceae bacterium]|jgi:hypothetical protein